MAQESNAPLWGLGGLIVGWAVGRQIGWGHGNCGGYGGGYGAGYPGYAGNCGPGYGYGGGYNGFDRPCHEDKQDDKIAHLMAESAANRVAIRKDEEIDALRYRLGSEVTDGKIYRATCRKVDGEVFISPRHMANPYHGEPQVIESHRFGDGFRRDGFRDGCRDGRRDGFRDDCCCDGNWY